MRPTPPFTNFLPVSYATLDDCLTVSTRFIRPKQSKERYIRTKESERLVYDKGGAYNY